MKSTILAILLTLALASWLGRQVPEPGFVLTEPGLVLNIPDYPRSTRYLVAASPWHILHEGGRQEWHMGVLANWIDGNVTGAVMPAMFESPGYFCNPGSLDLGWEGRLPLTAYGPLVQAGAGAR